MSLDPETPPADPRRPCVGFAGGRRVAAGSLAEVALAMKAALDAGATGPLLVFDDADGRCVDLDLRGTAADVAAALAPASLAPATLASVGEPPAERRGRGRPKLGVVAREVTLLPRHWDWLATQPGGASVALRRLVEAARRSDDGEATRRRAAHAAAYRFMATMAGDLPGFEEAARALFADDPAGLASQAAAWPADIRDHAIRLAFRDSGADPAVGS